MALYKQLKKLLFDANLSEVEVLIYIALLKKPVQTIRELVTRTGLPKTKVYDAFSRLKKLQMVEKNQDGMRALSLKALVSELSRSEMKLRKTAYHMKQIAPFLHAPRESIEEFETFYTPDQIADAYLSMSELPYQVNFDFGDFENWIKPIAPLDLAIQFRNRRSKHAGHHAICTTYGQNTAYFCKKEDQEKFKNQFDIHTDIDFKNRWIIFADPTCDYVLFNDISDSEYPVSALVKSKPIADAQRMQFDAFSKKFRN